MADLNPQQFLPGTEHFRPAQPHEQTPSQFHNRPDVFVHGRFVQRAYGAPELDMHSENFNPASGFHAGTEKAAHERLNNLGKPYEGTEPRFFHGRVDPSQMKNSQQAGQWEKDWPGPADVTPQHSPSDPGRRPDQIDEWRPLHHGSYYRNDYEDPGSTSVILPTKTVRKGSDQHVPENFKTWRQSVSDAVKSGQHVPTHVRAQYDASGGPEGKHAVVHTHFYAQQAHPLEHMEQTLPGLGGAWKRAYKKFGSTQMHDWDVTLEHPPR